MTECIQPHLDYVAFEINMFNSEVYKDGVPRMEILTIMVRNGEELESNVEIS
jgi:hypothetical protein